VKAGSVGGKANEWSARKAQLVVLRYKKAGGGYIGSKSASQKSLKKWTSEKWGNSSAKVTENVKKTGLTARYLPAKAWTKLSNSEKQATNNKKLFASKNGKQFIANTRTAKSAGISARKLSN
jgi:hypothetical protein